MRLALPTAAIILLAAAAFTQDRQPPPYTPTADELEQIRTRADALRARLSALRDADELYPDTAIYLKAAEWIVRHPEEFYTKAYFANTLAVLDTGLERAAQLARGEKPWTSRKGRVSRAYTSRVDGSLQPYGMIIPESYDPARPARLDVVLHGRAATMNEVSFLFAHDSPKPLTADERVLTLEVFGRTNNAYRWAGETDVFEALDSVLARYNVDQDRIVLRGFSMGGAGAWHIGLHHPDRWAAVEAGAGFVETREYARLKDVPDYQARTLHIYDAADYAHNAMNVPVVGYGGEVDPQLRASQLIRERIEAEMLKPHALFLVGPQTAHKWHPESRRESNAFLDQAAERGRAAPERISFVTYTPRYGRIFFARIDALERMYERAEVSGTRREMTTKNVARLELDTAGVVEVDGQNLRGRGVYERKNGRWSAAGKPGLLKRAGLQGPIDDAFMDSFLVVNASERFSREWAKWMRGDLRHKRESSVSADDLARYHLVVFGEPSSSPLVRRIASKLPVRWEGSDIIAGTRRFAAAEHTLALIYPNPLNPARYVVLNSGHTFGEREFRGTNALLYPRLGDYAVIRKSDGAVVLAGLFDERWKLQ